ncbi:MAG: hemerythrin domain-containing protein [Pseudomonadota bacterium]
MNGLEGMPNDFEALKTEISKHHSAQLELCNRLEKIADDLPDRYDKQECLSLSWQLYPAVLAGHKFEEEKLFPLILSIPNLSTETGRNLERLKFEHWEDETSAEDICFALKQMVQSPEKANIGKISYMLRGFFDGLRRHIAFESEYLLPQLKNALH